MRNNNILYLILQHGKKYWNFPKGRTEEGEEIIETAYREVFEETAIMAEDIKLHKEFQKSYRYKFRVEEGRVIYKEVVFFLGRVDSEKITISDEHVSYGWFDYEECNKLLLYKNSQKLLRDAHEFLLLRMFHEHARETER